MLPIGSPQLYIAGQLLAIAYLVFAIVVTFIDILYILRHYTSFPFGDHWIWLGVLYQKGPLAALASQYNEHRLTVPGLFYFLDHRLFAGRNAFLVIASTLIQISCMLLLILPVWQQPKILKPVRYVFAGFVAITMFWFIQAENFFYPFSLCLACSNLGILAALNLLPRLAGQPAASGRVALLLTGMVGCAAWATFSYGHGILIWPVLVLMCLLLRVQRRYSLIIVFAFCFVLALYFFHYKTPAGHANPLQSLRNPVQIVRYVTLMIGLPFFGSGTQDVTFLNHVGSYVITGGAILFAVVLFLQFAYSKVERKSREEVVYCALMVLCLGAAFITALGRSSFPSNQALSGRYAPVPLMFWISLIALLTLYLSRWEAQHGLGRAIWCGLLMAASMVTLSTQAGMGRYMATRERGQAGAAMSITVGVPDVPRIAEELYPHVALVSFVDQKATLFLGHSLFAHAGAALLGKPMFEYLHLAPSATCLGSVDSATLLAKPSSPGVRLVGWAWNVPQRHTASTIWIADEHMVIRGLGVTDVLRPDVSSAYGDTGMDLTGWIAYAQIPPQGVSPLIVYAGLDDGRSVCQIGVPRPPAL